MLTIRTSNWRESLSKNCCIAGLKDTTNPCCVVEEKGARLCSPGTFPCEERYSNLFWDKFHLTEAAYKIIASKCLNDSSICTLLESLKSDGKAVSGQPGRWSEGIFSGFNTLVLAIMISVTYFVANFCS